MSWYCRQGGQDLGPYTDAELRKLAAVGAIDPITPIRRDNDNRWIPAGNLNGLTFPPPPTQAAPAPGTRPVSVIIIAGLCFVVGTLGLSAPVLIPRAAARSELLRRAFELAPPPFWLLITGSFLLGVLYASAGVGLLRGRNWGRILCWFAVALHIAAEARTRLRAPYVEMIIGVVVFAAALFFLYQPDANAYFRRAAASGGRRAGPYVALALAGLSLVAVVQIYAYQLGWVTKSVPHKESVAATQWTRPPAPTPAEVEKTKAQQLRRRWEQEDRIAELQRKFGDQFRAHLPDDDDQTPQPLANETRLVRGHATPCTKGTAPAGGRLVGFEVGLGEPGGGDAVRACGPIYRSGSAETFGEQFGRCWERVDETKAKPGYAVGGLRVWGGFEVQSISAVYMRIEGDRLDPADSYDGPWLGRKVDPRHVEIVGGDGRSVGGVLGAISQEGELTSVGLIFDASSVPHQPPRSDSLRHALRPTPADPIRSVHDVHDWQAESTVAGTDETRLVGNAEGPAPKYYDRAPPGGLLVGFEFGQGDNLGRIPGIRPIYRVGDQEIAGERHGNQWKTTKKFVARAGYAVSGLLLCEGSTIEAVQPVYSRVDNGRLDIFDSYEGERLGHFQGFNLKMLSGRGRPIIGIMGAKNDQENIGLGLVFESIAK